LILSKRASGVLMSITSLPSNFGVGDVGPSALRFADLLSESKQRYWQVLPVTPTGLGNSPYNPVSAFAGNTLLISPEILERERLLPELPKAGRGQASLDRVNYGDASVLKREMIRKAYERFKERKENGEFEEFCQENSGWLESYSLYFALKEERNEPWYLWPKGLRDGKPDSLAEEGTKLRDFVDLEKFAQFEFFKQWNSLKEHCAELGIGLLGDLSFYVAYDSADVWSNREIFKLDSEGRPRFVGGVPPDYFSETGQLWGNPVYDWEQLKTQGFGWWTRRVRQTLKLFDVTRLDHFRGFVAYWEVPGRAKTAVSGNWVAAPWEAFFETVKSRFPSMPFVAEDLGVITPDVRAVMKRFDLPGMDVLLFAFDSGPDNPYLPENHSPDSVVYTGTHDTNTVRGWFTDDASPEQRARLLKYAGKELTGEQASQEFIRLALNSVASLSIIPMQDVLSLGSNARMNRPSFAEGNWEWRATSEQLASSALRRLGVETESSRRS
jgi:4-alpha-glucanotransferase